MTEIRVALFWNAAPAGELVYEVTNLQDAMGRLKDIVSSQPGLRDELIRRIRTNPDRMAILGGRIPKDVGRYADGVQGVLLGYAAEQPAFDFDRAVLPMPKQQPGVTY